jgi:EmrB/QacA subfamily drug resistance transporter
MENQTIDYSRKWYVLAAVGMGLFLSTIDGSIVNVALPTLVETFDTNFATVQWIVLGYMLTISTLILSIGRLADMIGKKSIYTAGFVIFTAGSVLCGLAPSIYGLIAFRVLQGLGGAMVIALGVAITTESFPPSERGKALGISGGLVSVGIVVGPVLGGLLIDSLGWRWIFYVNLPIGIVGTILAIRYIPRIKPPGGQRFDYWGGLTFLVSLLSFLVALTLGQQAGFTDIRVTLLLICCVLFLILFIGIERRIKEPMIDFQLFRNRLFRTGLTTGFVTFIAIAGTVILAPFYLEHVLGYTPKEVGRLLAVVPVAMAFAAPTAGALSDRFGTHLITVIGLAVLAFGYFALTTLGPETSAAGFLLRFLPIGVGMGIFQSPNNSAIMGAAPRRQLGIVSGTLAITRMLGQTTGIALLGALWASRVFYHTGSVLSGGATEATAEAQASGLQDTFQVITIAIIGALLLAFWALIAERRRRAKETNEPAEASPGSN